MTLTHCGSMLRDFSTDNNQVYHVFNRGTEKRRIFISKKDYERFFVNMVLFNTSGEVKRNLVRYDVSHPMLHNKNDNPLVDILSFCFMPNHYHLMLRQRLENGISKYLQRLQMGYAKYFNLFYERSGNLFQGSYKIVPISRANQFQYSPLYIHLNPLELLEPGWEDKGIKNLKRAIKFLETYPWSSLKTYMLGLDAPYLETKTISTLYPSPEEWRDAVGDWLKDVHHPMLHKILLK